MRLQGSNDDYGVHMIIGRNDSDPCDMLGFLLLSLRPLDIAH